ncbi:aldehyde dehydrogenase family protein [Saliphagus sp. GCM10025334]
MPPEYQNYVAGSWSDASTSETQTVVNPADTTDVVGEIQQSSYEDAQRAINAAQDAQADWAALPGPKRGRILRSTATRMAERKEELAETLTREEGKPLSEATGEVQRAIDIFYYYAEKARDYTGSRRQSSSRNADLYTIHEPIGVAGLITPWNYPIAIPAWKIAPALATGNTIVFKPAGPAPMVSRKVVECLDEVGLPDGVLNYVTGPGSEVGNEIVTNDGVDAVSFTGSAAVGNAVYQDATEGQKRVQCEMGGKNPTVVAPTADLDVAVDAVAGGAFGGTGQACTACSRAIVHTDVHDEFLDRVVSAAEDLEVGPGLEDYNVGPHVNESELESTLDYVEVGQTEGATLETGGEKLEGARFENGHFVSPAVFSGVESDMRIAQEEIFGPVLSVIEIESLREAVEVANDVDYGLSASIVTEDHSEAERFVRDVEAGVAKVNEKTTGLELHAPFGGYKQSSTETWREQGEAGLAFYTITKTVYDNF